MQYKYSDIKRKIKYGIFRNSAFFDFDFTIAKTVEKVWLRSLIDPRHIYSVDNDYFTRNRNLLQEEVFDMSFKDFNVIDLDKCKPVNEVIKLMNKLHDKGYRIVILTARHKIVEKYIDQFMNKYTNIKEYKFIGLDCGSAKSKLEIIEMLGSDGSYCIEDSIYNIGYISINSKYKLKYVHVSHHSEHTVLDFINQSSKVTCISDLEQL